MLPAALRQRLDRLNNFQSAFLAPLDGVDSTQYPSQGLTYTPELDLASSPPTSTGSKGSTVSVWPNTSGTSTPDPDRPSNLTAYESSSGLRWNRVVPAFSLLRNAGFEAQQPNSDTHLIRSLFIDGVGYLLEALPSDLTDDETRLIHDRLPGPLKANTGYASGSSSQNRPVASNSPSYLHRVIATLIVYGFIFVQLLLPYAKVLLNSLYTYERKYRVTERVLVAALETADGVGKGASNIGSTLTTLGEGRVFSGLCTLTAWTIESVAGGVYDGVNEGLVVLGASHRAANVVQPKPS
ncbi:hypothetical protein TMatcc_005350 [Talaromyces marneffei ATCC 18224]|uniref:Uncharacterized protein n=1 Tax=Talaromyces marneffei (strain ATCC 18224 / CBS 334.59 / QM 7333) TaxID=441960 RepID=B6QB75_TALMQ|nr:uncharacterized protein EYB26_006097 [Talaromyces marneffei]EEA26384.1 hypothetical protein PMAA_074560 [Talaromyces marneffei ATCC 18224]KAE8555076.1 hypothetical protein EYB25_003624 [Talaromyces marneffei]QGA18412.1 hypothetical protein EYB26_006097 [Talaromyces marneffei]